MLVEMLKTNIKYHVIWCNILIFWHPFGTYNKLQHITTYYNILQNVNEPWLGQSSRLRTMGHCALQQDLPPANSYRCHVAVKGVKMWMRLTKYHRIPQLMLQRHMCLCKSSKCNIFQYLSMETLHHSSWGLHCSHRKQKGTLPAMVPRFWMMLVKKMSGTHSAVFHHSSTAWILTHPIITK